VVIITDNAANKFNEIRQKSNNPEKTMLRISFGGFGWGGPKLQLTLDELKKDNDKIVESRNIKIIYDAEIEEYVNGTVIDYSNNWFNRGLFISGASSC